MTEEPKKWDVGTKAAVVLQLLRNERTAQELSLAYGVDVEQILVWKKQVIDRLPTILSENDDPRGCKLRRKSP